MTDSENMDDDSEGDLDAVLDEVSEKVADSLVSKLLKWFVRTTIGLVLFGVLWHYVDWGVWLFLGYVVMASVSLILTIYLHCRLVEVLGGRLVEAAEEEE